MVHAYHRPAKAAYRKLDMELMLSKLKSDPKKIPQQPTLDEIMCMFQKSVCLKVDEVKK